MKFKKGEIERVIIKEQIKHTDGRGFSAETFRIDNLPDHIKPKMSYISYTKPSIARGPHEHINQTDLFCFIGPGAFKVQL